MPFPRKYSKVGRCPLVFIVSDGVTGDFNKNLIFPKDLEQELHITNIRYEYSNFSGYNFLLPMHIL